jgi:hypothetical protein
VASELVLKGPIVDMTSPTRGRSPTKKKDDGGSLSGGKSPPHPKPPSPSPSRRSRTRNARRPRERVIERIIREGGSGNWPQLTKTNYNEWSLRMKLKLQARHLWDAVEFDDAEFDDDRNALDAICNAVPEDMIPALATKATAKEAWEAIRTLRIGDDRVRKATAQNLRAEYEAIHLREGEAIEDFALRLTGIVQRLATLGDPEAEEKVVAKYLRVVRPRYKQLVISIETLLDISQLSIEEVTGRLKAADDVEPVPAQTAGGKLLLTEEQWVERYKKKSTESGRGGSNSGGRGKGRGRGRGRGSGDSKGGSSSSRPPPDDPCPRCGKKGHWARDCRSKKKEEPAQEAHVAQEEEATLMMAVTQAQEEDSPPLSAPSIPSP